MVVVVGIPFARRMQAEVTAGGLAVAIARAAAKAGAAVQLVGKVGEGSDGDAVVLSVAAAGIGHAALLRGAVPVPVEDAADLDLDGSVDHLADLEEGHAEPDRSVSAEPAGSLDAADVALALRYLPEYRVVVAAEPVSAETFAAVVEAARWAEARLVVVAAAATAAPELSADATVLEAPVEDAEGAFATMLGRYVAALDRGADPADAFAAASNAAGWSPVAPEPA